MFLKIVFVQDKMKTNVGKLFSPAFVFVSVGLFVMLYLSVVRKFCETSLRLCL